MKTPVRLPKRRAGGRFASSSVSHATSSRRRCCGLRFATSRGEIEKKPGSKPSTRSRNAAERV